MIGLRRGVKAHTVKIHKPFFDLILTGEKRFEIRRNDRGYQPGDMIVAHEVKPSAVAVSGFVHTGRVLNYRIGHITDYEQKPGFVVWSVIDPVMWS